MTECRVEASATRKRMAPSLTISPEAWFSSGKAEREGALYQASASAKDAPVAKLHHASELEPLSVQWEGGFDDKPSKGFITMGELWWPSAESSTAPALSRGPRKIHRWLAIAEQVPRGKISEALREAYWEIEELFGNREFGEINSILEQLGKNALPPELAIGVIRSTYRARFMLPYWHKAVGRVKETFKQRGVPNWQNLFVGLPDA